MVVTPTLKAAEVAAAGDRRDGALRCLADPPARLAVGRRRPLAPAPPHRSPTRRTLPAGDLLLVDEAGMLDQDTARALLTIADETGARVALVGDRHQLPAVGRGGVSTSPPAWAHPTRPSRWRRCTGSPTPPTPHLAMRMRTGEEPGDVFDALCAPRADRLHASEAERTAALAEAGAGGDLVIADTRDQVAPSTAPSATASSAHRRGDTDARRRTRPGERLGIGDRVATRRNDRDLGVANRQTWTVTDIGERRRLDLRGRSGDRRLPADYATGRVELAYATTVYGAQGDTDDHAHLVVGETTGAASAYVAHDPRPPRQHRPPRRRVPRATPRASGSRCSAATAPTSAPPTQPASPSRPSTATGRKRTGPSDGRRHLASATRMTSGTAHPRRGQGRASVSDERPRDRHCDAPSAMPCLVTPWGRSAGALADHSPRP